MGDALASAGVLPKRNKSYKPRTGAYIPYEKVQEILASEPSEEYRLLFETMFRRGFRVSEVVGNDHIPGIRPIDIDPVKAKEVGYDCEHTVRVWRKRSKFEILPLPDDLYTKLMKWVKRYHIAKEERIFPKDRTTVYDRLSKYGYTIDGKRKIGCHVLRRSFGVWARASGMQIEDLQKIYSHENLAQTMQYIGVDKTRAFNNLAGFDKKILDDEAGRQARVRKEHEDYG